LLLRQWRSGQLDHFQRALDALRIGAADARGGGRIEFAQPRVHCRPADLRGFNGQLPPQVGVGRRQRRQAILQRTEIQTGAAHQQRHLAIRGDSCQFLQGVTPEFSGGIRLRGVADVDQTVRMALPRRCVGLGAADVQATINQRRINADQAAGEALREFDGERGLARGGRPHQENRTRTQVGWHLQDSTRRRAPPRRYAICMNLAKCGSTAWARAAISVHGHARWYRKGLPSGLRQGRARVLG